jgi:hypothetical protein
MAGGGLLYGALGEDPSAVSPYVEIGRAVGTDPILVLLNERGDNPFGAYLGEILRAEGLNCFQMVELSMIDSATLAQVPLSILAEGPLHSAQAEMLQEYVYRGGRLIAMRPDVRLVELLGLEALPGNDDGGYVSIETEHRFGQGMTTEALQFYGAADRYRLAGAQAVAWVNAGAEGSRGFPAATYYRYGDGQAALWAYDLAKSVIHARQGNPAWVGQERDGRDGIRAHDAFVDWVDLDRIGTPQADEQMRFFSRAIQEMLADTLPLPRLWYFPGQADAMLVATGDSHQNPASAIEEVLSRVERYSGHMSIYYAPELSSNWRRAARKTKRWVEGLPPLQSALDSSAAPPAPQQVADWRSRGHEFALHPYVEEGLEAGWNRYWQEFTGMGYGPVPPTVRTHRVLWTGWTETARVQAGYGMGLNLDYYHIGPAFRKENGEWAYGYYTGSGLPMRFIDEQGRVLNIYQQLTQLADEHLLEVPWGGHAKLEPEDAIEVSKMLLRRSVQRFPSAIVAQFHVDPYAVGGRYADQAGRWLGGTLGDAVELGVPVWSAEQWLAFTKAREGAVLRDVTWQAAGQRLSFQLAAPADSGAQLTVMVPLRHAGAALVEAKVDGQGVAYGQRTMGGADYACVPVRGGPHDIVVRYV